MKAFGEKNLLTLWFEVQCYLLPLETLSLASVHSHGNFYGLNENIPINIVFNHEVIGSILQLQADALPAIKGFLIFELINIFGKIHFRHFWWLNFLFKDFQLFRDLEQSLKPICSKCVGEWTIYYRLYFFDMDSLIPNNLRNTKFFIVMPGNLRIIWRENHRAHLAFHVWIMIFTRPYPQMQFLKRLCNVQLRLRLDLSIM